MKLPSILALLCLISFALPAQTDLSADQWQADLDFLQKTVHTDYPFLFKKNTVAEFDAAVKELREAIPKMETHEIIVGLARIVALFEYGHTSIGLSGWYARDAFTFNQMPYN